MLQESVLVLFGGSQMGKSTFLNTILIDGQAPADVGDGSGESTTRYVNLYQTVLGTVVDCPGYDDTELLIDMEDLAKHVALELSVTRVSNVKFLLFDSLGHSSIQIEKTVLELFKAFGDVCRSSIVVIASKRDLINERFLSKRLSKLQDHMSKFGIGNSLVTWQSEGIDEDELQSQLRNLVDELANIPSTPSTELEILTKIIADKAMELFESQPRSMVIDVPESYAVEYTTTEVRPETYCVNERVSLFQRNARDYEPFTVSLGVATLGISTVVHALTPVDNWVEKTREVSTKVTKSRTEYRTVEKEVPLPIKPVESFYEAARLAIVEDARRRLTDELEHMPPLLPTELHDLNERIKAKAEDLFTAQPKTIETWVEESYTVDYTEVEWYEEKYYENKEESLLDISTREKVAATAIFGALTFGIGPLTQALWQVDNWVEKTRQVPREVTRTKTEYRTVRKDVSLEIQPIESFYEIARAAVIDDARRKLLGSCNSGYY